MTRPGPEDAPTPRGLTRSRRVTAAMVADLAGVSTATVSLVANGKTSGRVSAEITERVRAAISELGYVVDRVGSSLATGTSNFVVFVAPDIANPFFARVIHGARAALGEHFQVLLSVAEPGQFPVAQDIRELFALRPAGLLVEAPSISFLHDLDVDGPLVLLDAPNIESLTPSVNLDVATGACQLVDHLADRGHRIVAYLDSVTGTATFDIRRDSFLTRARELGMTVAPVIASTIDVGTSAAQFATHYEQWLALGVTAVACCTDLHAYGILQGARDAGLTVPGDLAVSGFDDLPFSRTSNPGLTSVRLPGEELGRLAGHQLRTLIEGGQLDEIQLTLPSELIIRGSTDLSR